jgi:hypothetical protein
VSGEWKKGEWMPTAPDEPLDLDVEATEDRNKIRLQLPGEWGVYLVEKNIVDIGEERGVLATYVTMVRLS